MKRFLAVLIPIFLLFSPVLVGGKIFANGELFGLIYPGYEFYHSALKSGESFLWNPYGLGGFPFAASFLEMFSPIFMALFYLFSAVTAYHLVLFLNILLGAFFMSLLLKEFGLSFWPQIAGALVFVAGGWHWVTDIGIASAYLILPLLLLLLWKSREKNWPILAGAATVGYAMLTVQYNWLAMISVLALAFSLFLGRTVFLKFLAMGILGAPIGLIQILPSFIYSQFSARATAPQFSQSAVGPISAFDLPRIFLANFRLPYVGASESFLFLGALPLFFMLLALGSKDRLARFFGVTVAAAFLIAVKYSPLFWLIHKLPVFSGLRGSLPEAGRARD